MNVAQLPGLKEYLEDPNCIDKVRPFNNKQAPINTQAGTNVDSLIQEAYKKHGVKLPGNKYFDWEGPPNVFSLADKDANGQFPLKIIKKRLISPDTYMIDLKFPNPQWTSGLWAGGHYLLHQKVGGETLTRPYTPITPVNKKGNAVFVIKVYRNNPAFPDGGKFSQALENNF